MSVTKESAKEEAATKKTTAKQATAKQATAKQATTEMAASPKTADAKVAARHAVSAVVESERRVETRRVVARPTTTINRDVLKAKPAPAPRFAVPIGAMLAAIGLYTLWGGQTVAIKYSLVSFPPLWSAFWRFVLGASCLAIICWVRGISLVPDGRQWKLLWGQSWIFIFQAGTMNWGIQLSTASLASVVIGGHPLFASVLAPILLSRDPFNKERWIGLGVAFGAMAFAIVTRDSSSISSGSTGIFVLLLSSMLLGGRIITGAKLTESMRPELMVFWQMTLSLPFFFVGALTTETVVWSSIHWAAVAGLLYQGVIVAGLNFVIAATLVQRYSPSVITSFGFLVPITGVLFSALILGESVHSGLFVGLVGVGVGLYIITRSRRRSKPASKAGRDVIAANVAANAASGMKIMRAAGTTRSSVKS